MADRLPALTAKQLEKAINKYGFYFVRQESSHKIYANNQGRFTTVPAHAGETIGRGLLRKIMNDIEISRKEFLSLLKK